jgi:hypothetical protein
MLFISSGSASLPASVVFLIFFTFPCCLAVSQRLQFQKRLLFLFLIVFSKLILHCYGRLPWDVFHRTLLHLVLVFSVADPGCLSRTVFFPARIPDPNFFHPGYTLKNLSILTRKTVSKLSEI